MRYWLFQGNPVRWRIFDYLRDHPDESFTDWDWSVARHRHNIRVGDGAVLWISGSEKQRGVYALGKIIEEAEETISDSVYWTDPGDRGRRRWSVKMSFDRVLFEDPIFARDLRTDPRFAHASILRTPRFGNPHELTHAEWRAILDQLR